MYIKQHKPYLLFIYLCTLHCCTIVLFLSWQAVTWYSYLYIVVNCLHVELIELIILIFVQIHQIPCMCTQTCPINVILTQKKTNHFVWVNAHKGNCHFHFTQRKDSWTESSIRMRPQCNTSTRQRCDKHTIRPLLLLLHFLYLKWAEAEKEADKWKKAIQTVDAVICLAAAGM